LPVKLYEKEKVLDSCFIMFSKYGYRNTTTAMLAEKAGISKALLFHHFKSKKKIYLSVLERIFDKMSLEVSDELLTEYNDYFEARANSGHDKISYLRSNPEANKILLEAFQLTPDELKADIKMFSLKIKKINYFCQTLTQSISYIPGQIVVPSGSASHPPTARFSRMY